MWKIALSLLGLLSLLGSDSNTLEVKKLLPTQYMMRVHPRGDSLLRTLDPAYAPWLPNRQFGWLITDYATLDYFFAPVEGGVRLPRIDFENYFVLALIRYDVYPWNFEPLSLKWEKKTLTLELAYQLVPAGKKRKDPLLSNQLLLVKKDADILRLGINNLRFSLAEQIMTNDPDVPSIGQDPLELIFPPTYTLEDLLPKTVSRPSEKG